MDPREIHNPTWAERRPGLFHAVTEYDAAARWARPAPRCAVERVVVAVTVSVGVLLLAAALRWAGVL